MAYPPSLLPASLPADNVDDNGSGDPDAIITAADVNDTQNAVNTTQSAVNDIITELGANPSGASPDVTARLTSMQSAIDGFGSADAETTRDRIEAFLRDGNGDPFPRSADPGGLLTITTPGLTQSGLYPVLKAILTQGDNITINEDDLTETITFVGAPSTSGTGGAGQVGVWDVTQAPYNANKVGGADARQAIQNAINDCSAAGGGIVYLPPGTYRIDYAANTGLAGTGGGNVRGGLQLQKHVWLKGAGTATLVYAAGTWAAEAGIIGIGHPGVGRDVASARVSDMWIKGTSGRGHVGSPTNVMGLMLRSQGTGNSVVWGTSSGQTDPDACHRFHDLVIWDCDRGIDVDGIDDQGMIVYNVRGRWFNREGVKASSGNGGPDNFWHHLDFSSANRGGGTSPTYLVNAANSHWLSCKAWYAKRSTAYAASATFYSGAGFAIEATRTVLVDCEAQDNGGHGFIVRYGKVTMTSCWADSNSYFENVSGAAGTNECSGLYIGAGAGLVTAADFNAFNRSDGHRDQKHGVYIESASRGLNITGIAWNNAVVANSPELAEQVVWSGAPHTTHLVSFAVGCVDTVNGGTVYDTTYNLPASGGGGGSGGSFIDVVKTNALEATVTGTTLANDNTLFADLTTSSIRYRVRGFIVLRAGATGGGKLGVALTRLSGAGTVEGFFRWTHTAKASTDGDSNNTLTYSTVGTTNTVTVKGVGNVAGSGTADNRIAAFEGYVFVGASTTARVTVQAAEDATEASAGMRIKGGSFIEVRQEVAS